MELATLDAQMARDNFWEDVEEAQEVLKRRAQLQAPADRWQKLLGQVEEAVSLLDLAKKPIDAEVLQEVQVETSKLALEIEHFELESLLCGEMDTANALCPSIPVPEVQSRRIGRICCYACTCVGLRRTDIHMKSWTSKPGEEAGIKSTTLKVIGRYAFGYLKAENGVHRLVRISPFDAARRRHTSFAAVLVTPEVDETIKV